MIYTAGHSNLSLDDFVNILHPASITDCLWDVRSHPGSRLEHFNKEPLQEHLQKEVGIGYYWCPELGGWTAKHLELADEFKKYDVDVAVYAEKKFPKQRIAAKRDKQKHTWWNVGLWDYQFFMMLPEFLSEADNLIQISRTANITMLCAEVLPWKCHRSMIADYLTLRGVRVTHLQPQQKDHAAMLGDRLYRYHPDVLKSWHKHYPITANSYYVNQQDLEGLLQKAGI